MAGDFTDSERKPFPALGPRKRRKVNAKQAQIHQRLCRRTDDHASQKQNLSRDRIVAKGNHARTGLLATVTWLPTVGIHCSYKVECSESFQ